MAHDEPPQQDLHCHLGYDIDGKNNVQNFCRRKFCRLLFGAYRGMPFMPNGLVSPYKKDESICQLRDVCLV